VQKKAEEKANLIKNILPEITKIEKDLA